MMELNQYELIELLEGEAVSATLWYTVQDANPWMKLSWVQEYNEMAILRHNEDQTFTVMISRTAEMWKGATISVDEILDIVL